MVFLLHLLDFAGGNEAEARLGPGELTGGGFGQGPVGHELHLAIQTQFHADQGRQATLEVGTPGRVCLTTLDQQDASLIPIRARRRESECIAYAHFRLRFGNMLQVLRPDIAAMDDDQVLLAPGDGDHAIDQVTDIPGVEPAVLRQGIGRLRREIEVPGHDAGTTHMDDTALPVIQADAALNINDRTVGYVLGGIFTAGVMLVGFGLLSRRKKNP